MQNQSMSSQQPSSSYMNTPSTNPATYKPTLEEQHIVSQANAKFYSHYTGGVLVGVGSGFAFVRFQRFTGTPAALGILGFSLLGEITGRITGRNAATKHLLTNLPPNSFLREVLASKNLAQTTSTTSSAPSPFGNGNGNGNVEQGGRNSTSSSLPSGSIMPSWPPSTTSSGSNDFSLEGSVPSDLFQKEKKDEYFSSSSSTQSSQPTQRQNQPTDSTVLMSDEDQELFTTTSSSNNSATSWDSIRSRNNPSANRNGSSSSSWDTIRSNKSLQPIQASTPEERLARKIFDDDDDMTTVTSKPNNERI